MSLSPSYLKGCTDSNFYSTTKTNPVDRSDKPQAPRCSSWKQKLLSGLCSVTCCSNVANKDKPNVNSFGECAICFEEMKKKSARVLKCGHMFHGSCCERVVAPPSKRLPLCPLCRSPYMYSPMKKRYDNYKSKREQGAFPGSGYLPIGPPMLYERNTNSYFSYARYYSRTYEEESHIELSLFLYQLSLGIPVSEMTYTVTEAQRIWNIAQFNGEFRHTSHPDECFSSIFDDLKLDFKRLVLKFKPDFLEPNEVGYYFGEVDAEVSIQKGIPRSFFYKPTDAEKEEKRRKQVEREEREMKDTSWIVNLSLEMSY